MTLIPGAKKTEFDRTNAMLAGLVFLASFIVYAITVQRSFSFWDCGEFIACSAILGIPHPPGTPLFVLLGRVATLIPIVEDIAHRINYLSVVSSAFTAMFSYLLTVKIVRYFHAGNEGDPLNRLIAYAGGLAGGFLVAFSATNWANSVEAEVYGLSLALSVGIVWLTVRYFELRGTAKAGQILVLVIFLAMVGVGVHMSTFIVVPICAIFFILNEKAEPRDYMMICGFAILELLLIILFSNIGATAQAFTVISAILGLTLLTMLFRKINWGILIAIAITSSIMISFSLYLMVALPLGSLALVALGLYAKKKGFRVQWRTAAAMIIIGLIGFSSHLYIPIRSSANPRIDENNPSRDFRTFINFLDRKQYGQISMVERAFKRRGAWSHQFGRHPNMGFWSYFEEQYSAGGVWFIPLFVLGLIGMIVAIKKRFEVGMPFFTLFILCSVGLVLYMNLADGTNYSFETGDAYLEVRNRDYFFTPAFVFFGIAMGLGVAALMQFVKDRLINKSPEKARLAVYAASILLLLPVSTLARNFHSCDRSENFLPYNYAKNILDSCEQDAILFTAGDNDTFPVWCLQEAYGYRRDVRVVNLSLLNTDWYCEQMKNRFGVRMSLTDEQIVWHAFEIKNQSVADKPFVPFDNLGQTIRWALGKVDMVSRPMERWEDRPRRRKTYLYPLPLNGRIVRVQDMVVDDIIFENFMAGDSTVPVYFSSPPYAESPLNLRQRSVHTGLLYKIELNPESPIDVDRGYDLFMKTYNFAGFESSAVFRDDNATGVFLGVGMNSIRVHDELVRRGDSARADSLSEHMISVYPEYWQAYLLQSDKALAAGDTTKAINYWQQLHDTLQAFHESNESNLYYLQDLGLAKTELGRLLSDTAQVQEGLRLVWEAFDRNSNSNYSFRKLVSVLSQNGGSAIDLNRAAQQFSAYGINLKDDLLQRLMGGRQTAPSLPPPGQ